MIKEFSLLDEEEYRQTHLDKGYSLHEVLKIIEQSDLESLHYEDAIELISKLSKRELSPFSISLPKPKVKNIQFGFRRSASAKGTPESDSNVNAQRQAIDQRFMSEIKQKNLSSKTLERHIAQPYVKRLDFSNDIQKVEPPSKMNGSRRHSAPGPSVRCTETSILGTKADIQCLSRHRENNEHAGSSMARSQSLGSIDQFSAKLENGVFYEKFDIESNRKMPNSRSRLQEDRESMVFNEEGHSEYTQKEPIRELMTSAFEMKTNAPPPLQISNITSALTQPTQDRVREKEFPIAEDPVRDPNENVTESLRIRNAKRLTQSESGYMETLPKSDERESLQMKDTRASSLSTLLDSKHAHISEEQKEMEASGLIHKEFSKSSEKFGRVNKKSSGQDYGKIFYSTGGLSTGSTNLTKREPYQASETTGIGSKTEVFEAENFEKYHYLESHNELSFDGTSRRKISDQESFDIKNYNQEAGEFQSHQDLAHNNTESKRLINSEKDVQDQVLIGKGLIESLENIDKNNQSTHRDQQDQPDQARFVEHGILTNKLAAEKDLKSMSLKLLSGEKKGISQGTLKSMIKDSSITIIGQNKGDKKIMSINSVQGGKISYLSEKQVPSALSRQQLSRTASASFHFKNAAQFQTDNYSYLRGNKATRKTVNDSGKYESERDLNSLTKPAKCDLDFNSRLKRLEQITASQDGGFLVNKIKKSYTSKSLASGHNLSAVTINYIDESHYNKAIETNALQNVLEEAQVLLIYSFFTKL